ncbi:MAG: tRNA (adenosine(37)-N6)-threonylcarbamoyltransferase complex transferase subunit TsaD [Oscillospiraceae bacterium]|nr:tRNA (adenosine(37)-N6)-threonylcarbamoyltransferase complex transferase subunit TsaD [Oscillospiraceae bacterium]
MKILAIESSCDDASASIVEDGVNVLSLETLHQNEKFAKFGGVVPELASRGHVGLVFKAAKEALNKANITANIIDAVAVTFAPGLIGSLLTGLSFAKGFAIARGVPLIAVHHLKGHVASNYIENPKLKPPFLCLVVSGGHTSIFDVKNYNEFKIIGKSIDDAAGEVFDKVARYLEIPYPGGYYLDELANKGNPEAFVLPIPEISEFNFSFSGIKTWSINKIKENLEKSDFERFKLDMCASLRFSVVKYLSKNLISAAKKLGRTNIAIAGGVASNSLLRHVLKSKCELNGINFFCPSPKYCTDNAAMIGIQGFYEFKSGNTAPLDINAYANKKPIPEYIRSAL